MPCVSINRADEDTELVVGQYAVDATGDRPTIHYRGLGGVPAQYRLGHREEGLVLQDEQWPVAGDEPEDRPKVSNRALGDIPAAYRLNRDEGRSILDDDRWPQRDR